MIYFRRPQTPFVDSDTSQKPQSQWKLVAEGNEDETADPDASNSSFGSGGLDGSSGGLDGSGEGLMKGSRGSSGSRRGSGGCNGNDSDSLVEEDPTKPFDESEEDNLEEDTHIKGDQLQQLPEDPLKSDIDNDDDGGDMELAQSLEKRLQLEIKHHPESVLLCGYFHEEIMEACLALSTYLPGVHARELRVYYGEGVLKIAGARALYHLVQRFERSFALDERLVDTSQIVAMLQEGILMVRVPLLPMPPPPVKIKLIAATPMILFKDRRDLFCLDIDVPGVQLKDLTVYYSNGVLRLLWERLEPTSDNTNTGGFTKASKSLNTSSHLKQMRFEREIPINTLQVDTNKLIAYLDHHTKPTGVLTIIAPIKLKRSTRPIEVRTAKDMQGLESGGSYD